MFVVEEYLHKLIGVCKNAFGDRLVYVGFQGSYMRGEATDKSDIDVMIVLEDFSVADMDVYREILKEIGEYEKSCGFICGKDELMRWNPLEVYQLRHTTKDLLGELKEFLPSVTMEDEINYVKLSLGNLYHELCHRYIHADRKKNNAAFRGTCKGLFFLIQNLHFLESGTFVVTKRELKEQVSEEDRAILEMAELPDNYDYDMSFCLVFDWCQNAFNRIDRIRCRNNSVHSMNLQNEPFEMMKNGQKTIELRLYDEKRQKVKEGDEIVFTNVETNETLKALVLKLHRFDSFETLYRSLPLLKCGYAEDNVSKATSSDMERYYSAAEQKRYGVVGIEISLLKGTTD